MPSPFDETDFVDHDIQAAQKSSSALSSVPPLSSGTQRPPTREELDDKVTSTQQKLAELKRVQEELERERAGLEEARRRQTEFQTGREEMARHLTRGLGLLNEAEFAARRDAEQMTKSIADLREALVKVQAINEATWTQETWNVELTRALTIIENARMEWNAARLKWPLLDRASGDPLPQPSSTGVMPAWPRGGSFLELTRIGLAFTWPLLVLVLVFGLVWLLRS